MPNNNDATPEIRSRFGEYVARVGLRSAAAAIAVTPTHIRTVLRGVVPIGTTIPEFMGYVRRVVHRYNPAADRSGRLP